MRRTTLGVAALAAALGVNPIAARADDAAQALPWQIADALTTRLVLSRPCGYERDPLVRGVVRSDVGAIAGAVVSNLLLRRFAHKHGTFRIVIGTEATMVADNLHTYYDDRPQAGRYCK